MPLPKPARAAAVLILALAGAAIACGAGLDGQFHLDDGTTIRSNWRLRSLDRALAWPRARAAALSLAAAAVARNLMALDRPGASAGLAAGGLGP